MNYKSLWLCAVCLIGLASVSEGLMCYHCSNCRYEVGTALECNYGYDVCLKLTIVGRVEKSCGKQTVCGFGLNERGTVTQWNRLQHYLSDVNTDLLRIPEGMEASSVMCCASNYCNAAPISRPTNYFPLVLPLGMMYLMMPRC